MSGELASKPVADSSGFSVAWVKQTLNQREEEKEVIWQRRIDETRQLFREKTVKREQWWTLLAAGTIRDESVDDASDRFDVTEADINRMRYEVFPDCVAPLLPLFKVFGFVWHGRANKQHNIGFAWVVWGHVFRIVQLTTMPLVTFNVLNLPFNANALRDEYLSNNNLLYLQIMLDALTLALLISALFSLAFGVHFLYNRRGLGVHLHHMCHTLRRSGEKNSPRMKKNLREVFQLAHVLRIVTVLVCVLNTVGWAAIRIGYRARFRRKNSDDAGKWEDRAPTWQVFLVSLGFSSYWALFLYGPCFLGLALFVLDERVMRMGVDDLMARIAVSNTRGWLCRGSPFYNLDTEGIKRGIRSFAELMQEYMDIRDRIENMNEFWQPYLVVHSLVTLTISVSSLVLLSYCDQAYFETLILHVMAVLFIYQIFYAVASMTDSTGQILSLVTSTFFRFERDCSDSDSAVVRVASMVCLNPLVFRVAGVDISMERLTVVASTLISVLCSAILARFLHQSDFSFTD